MARIITQRELRNESGKIMKAVDAGESFIVTRNGVAAAELRPIQRRRFVATTTLLESTVGLAPIDAKRFFTEVDDRLDQSLRHG